MSIQHAYAPDGDGRGTEIQAAERGPLSGSSFEDHGALPVELARSAAEVGGAFSAVRERGWVDPAIWERRDMRVALAARDLRTIYRLLQRFGVSQRRIAARAEQSQSEVSEILTGRRKVISYELLVRVAAGLGVPRGWMGLAYDPATVQFLNSGVRR